MEVNYGTYQEDKIEEVSSTCKMPKAQLVAISPDGKFFAVLDTRKLEFHLGEIRDIKNYESTNLYLADKRDMTRRNLKSSPMGKLCEILHWNVEATNPRDDDVTSGRTVICRVECGSGPGNDNSHFAIPVSDPMEIRGKDCYCFSIGGIVTIVHESDYPPYTNINISIINTNGINKISLRESNTGINRPFVSHVNFPEALEAETPESCMTRLHACIYHRYFLLTQINSGARMIGLYDLSTLEPIQYFGILERNMREPPNQPNVHYAISSNRQLFAFSYGTGEIRIYWMENGLEVGYLLLGGENEQKIRLLEFVENDEKLFIMVEEYIIKDHGKALRKQDIKVWNFFSNNNVIRSFQGNEIKGMKVTSQMRRPGKIFAIDCDEGDERGEDEDEDEDLDPSAHGHDGDDEGDEGDYKEEDDADEKEEIVYEEKGGKIYSVFDLKVIAEFIKGKRLSPNYLDNLIEEEKYNFVDGEKEGGKHGRTRGHFIIQKRGSEYIKLAVDNSEQFKHVVKDREPWGQDKNYLQTSCFIDAKENLQLFIGRSTVQVWRRSLGKKKPTLEYIWTSDVDPEEEVDRSLNIRKLKVGDKSFFLEVYWKKASAVEKTKVIRWPCKNRHVKAVKHACKALGHLYSRKKRIKGLKRYQKFERLIESITFIIWRFIEEYPEVWRMMDIRYNVMDWLVRGRSLFLIKYILFRNKVDFGKGESNIRRNLHIPRLTKWKKSGDSRNFHHFDISCPSNALEWAIQCYDGISLKEIIIIGYLLEYYTNRAKYHVGWMITVSRCVPMLYDKRLDYYAETLFYKDCFAGQEINVNSKTWGLLSQEYLIECGKSKSVKALRPYYLRHHYTESSIMIRFLIHLVNLWRWVTKSFIDMFRNFFQDWTQDKVASDISLRLVPLPKFIQEYDGDQSEDNKTITWKKTLGRILRSIIIPQGYGKSSECMSPLIKTLKHVSQDTTILDNPAMEAVINYKWQDARNYFQSLFFIFMVYAVCFGIVSWAYITHVSAEGVYRNLIVFIIALFYYLAYYLFAVEVQQFLLHGIGKYFNIFNFFDLISLVAPVVVMSIMVATSFQFEDAFGSVTSKRDLVIAISFSVLILWAEFVLYLRSYSAIAIYIYMVFSILKEVWPFLAFLILVVIGFAHAMYILLARPTFLNLIPNTSSFTITNTTTNATIDAKITSDFDPNLYVDNPFSYFLTSMEATYLWLGGNWSQEGTWVFWAVQALSLLGSILLVTVLQNLLIALMGGVYSTASEKSHSALLRFRADLILDYEILDKIYIFPPEKDPDVIWFSGSSKNINDWLGSRKFKSECLYKKYEDEYICDEYEFSLDRKNAKQDSDGSFWVFPGEGKRIEDRMEIMEHATEGVEESEVAQLKKSMDEKIKDLQNNFNQLLQLLQKE
ncbi:12570_t:CDS:2 [Acaulospora morrowiae]|uniref:12570_t:CDS:1 n=1 Tax=Acaulospora morrowiae TaxID=94023 RepID=A0A9N9A8K9_9GLOM|nr:12570_t:CDS:2 [Acaulospora morrowiae]